MKQSPPVDKKKHVATADTNATNCAGGAAAAAAEVIEVDFTRPRPKSKGGGLYREGKVFWERPTVDGGRTWRKLDAITEQAARLELAKKRSDQALSRRGLADDPYKRDISLTVQDLAKFYLSNGCPKRNLKPREGKQLSDEKKRIEHLLNFFGNKSWNQIGLQECQEYFRERVKTIRRKNSTGERTVDLELNALSSIYRWAKRHDKRTGVKANPLSLDRPRFRIPEDVRHCRDLQPESAEELHLLAATLFQYPMSAALGWQLIFEAFLGQRTHEILNLRWDAKTKTEPGYLAANKLWLYQSRTSKGTYPFARIYPALRTALEELKAWRDARYPNSPWFFPSPYGEGANHVDKSALTKALARICPKLGLPHRTSHGLRSYFVNVLRAQGIPDAEIALLIGHESAGKLIVQVYGKISDQEGDKKLTWLPAKGDPAWTCFLTLRPFDPKWSRWALQVASDLDASRPAFQLSI